MHAIYTKIFHVSKDSYTQEQIQGSCARGLKDNGALVAFTINKLFLRTLPTQILAPYINSCDIAAFLLKNAAQGLNKTPYAYSQYILHAPIFKYLCKYIEDTLLPQVQLFGYINDVLTLD